MKTFLKILLYFLLFLFIVLLTAPLLFKKQILQIAKEQANANLNAKVDFKDINLSLIKKFPNLYVGLEEVSVIGIEDFEGDTLVYFDAFEVKVDLISAIQMDSIKVREISLKGPVMNAIVLEDGRANWDIAKETSEEEDQEVDTTASTGATPSVKLKRFEISDGRISYIDRSSNMEASMSGFNYTLTGDLSETFTTILMNLDILKLNFTMDGMKYAKDVRLNFMADIAADLQNSIFTIEKNELSLNDLTLGLSGNVEMKGEDILTDLKYYTTNTSFKTLLSLVPALYMNDFAGLKTSGEIKVDGTVIGTVSENLMPNVTLDLGVKNAMFSYPDLPKQVDNVNIAIKVLYHGIFEDSTTINLEKFHLELDGNPVDMNLYVRTPMSDMTVNGQLMAKIDLATIADAVPLDGSKLSGMVNSNIDIMGAMSSIENEKYEDFKADGFLKLDNVIYDSPDLGYAVAIEKLDMAFSPKYVHLNTIDAKVGESDFHLNGRLENFIPFVFEDKTIYGQLDFTSSYINVDAFMTDDTTAVVEEEEVDTTAMEIIQVPSNIDFKLKTNLAKVKYDKLVINDITGALIVKDGKVLMGNLNLNTMKGFINVTGEYNTQDMDNPFVDLDLNVSKIDISSAVYAFNTIEEMVPISKHAFGNISSTFTFSTFLENDMTPRMKSIVSSGSLTSESIKIENAKSFNAIGEKLGSDKFKELTLKDVDLQFDIRDGKILVQPFDVKLGSGNAMISGEQFLDQSIDFNINLSMPKAGLGSGASTAINSLSSNAAAKGIQIDPGENLNFDIKLQGTTTDPKVVVDMKSNAKNAVQQVKQRMVEKSKEELNKRADQAKAKANSEAQRIIDNAEKQAAQVKEKARVAAAAAKKESYDKADKIQKEAEGKPKFARDIAKKAADKLREEGDEKAAKILDEADKKSEEILDKARKEAAAKTQ